MHRISVQTKNVVQDENPFAGFAMLKRAGFNYCDFSLNGYLKNANIYQGKQSHFFDKSVTDLTAFFSSHKEAAKKAGISIYQMHMPYPIYVPKKDKELNNYLWNTVALKSMEVCHFLDCPYIVAHGLKMVHFLGTEQAEWQETEKFIDHIAPLAKEMGIIICIENLYDNVGGHLVEGPCCDVRKAVERIDRINDRYRTELLGFCFDTGHANIVGIDFEDFITTLDYRLKVLHIHDNDGKEDLHQIPYTFSKTRENTSSTNWEGFISGLKRIRYDGVFNFETAPVLTSFPEDMRENVLKFIRGIGDYFACRVGNLK